ncbi:NHL repeat-containing protein [Morchella conica CCBAS932]|uniref:NHL repeat-containing protein n=1 Tax=Morchella conica CCBAS932 TaxID=1392247 RepID=A0A3N4L5H9_9PEZI|nr:NHL repeat-containing protein [Morchella conica CCBAS932]
MLASIITTLFFSLFGLTAAAQPKTNAWALPGNNSFPEGIARQARSPYFYTGSWITGTIWRGNVNKPDVEVFIPGGNEFNITSASGMKVTKDNNLVVAGAATGKVFVICLESQQLLHRFQAPEGALLNDLAVAKNGNIFITDSFLPKLYVITPEHLENESVDQELETFAKLEAPFEHETGQFNSNGIVVTDDQENVLIGDYNSHAIFRLCLGSKTITKVDFGNVAIGSPDGMLMRGNTLYAVNGDSTLDTEAFIDVFDIRKPYTTGKHVRRIKGQGMLLPSTAAFDGNDLLVANFQIGKAATADPTLPFTIVRVSTKKSRTRGSRMPA